MGYGMSRLEDEYYEPEVQETDGSSSVKVNDEFPKLHNDIFHMTRMRSGLSESIYKSMGTNRGIISTAKLLSGREVDCSGKGMFSSGDRAFVLGRYVPMNGPEFLDRMDSRAYVSQFSADGTLFVAGFQGSHIRIYDVDRGWIVHKDIHARSLRWTISDVSLSPDQRYLVYSSLAPIIHIVNVGNAARESYANVTDIHDGLDFSQHEDVQYAFGIFSVKFSSDGRELVAGSNDESIYVYDLHANKLTLRLPAHTSDVNTVAFADESGHLIYSGSDDTLCKVWDRRCLSTGQAAGVLTGHLHGITHIDSHGDGRSFISNGKDQAIKLWDIRKMMSNADSCADGAPTWDYRYSRYPKHHQQLKHPHDQSLATYRGHSVLRTLIRCYFSPAYSTGQKYIYTGSYDSNVYIYDVVSGSQVAKLNGHQMAIRDCSWHPIEPTLVSSSWDGRVAKWTSARDEDASDVD
ncbi:LEC14B protein-like isoform X1 [Panicum virgatum]|uniref:LEC14B homolog n=3 Tax=Panicum virgatum TaxID=38727 RepID=A0A8T0UEL2_PANVG|nr:LEC14B protein-like isoform X1 [Panicum virgatum]KAG2619343.1 hypothetical protein PVAP13_3NG141402 [Panicum virgatum]KAG2619344.1 hypothetical protein PVAP13_3NG141402 [Panicum virgatum]KAG2619349.1 hypothetical protein PVAP13_3NG141402 [Panicum virgatum]KAG2619350.1 hypothetical protein PVAP13_3NG141402 [Panicum virgatum]KAG2619351.1 hypothetical protein PVAP13_3NG141402 [Panicum virgatum]